MPAQMWMQIHPDADPEQLGLIATFIRPNDERPAQVQLEEYYGFGWYSMKDSFTIDPENGALMAKDDPDLLPLWGTRNLRGELVVVYSYGITAVIHDGGDGTETPVLVDVARLS